MDKADIDKIMEELLALAKEVELGRTGSWNPGPGDFILGQVVRIGMRPSRFGECLVAEVRKYPDGKIEQVWATTTVLKQLFEENHVQVGNAILIKRLDDGTNGTQAYKRYFMLVDRTGQEQGATTLEAPKPTPPTATA